MGNYHLLVLPYSTVFVFFFPFDKIILLSQYYYPFYSKISLTGIVNSGRGSKSQYVINMRFTKLTPTENCTKIAKIEMNLNSSSSTEIPRQ